MPDTHHAAAIDLGATSGRVIVGSYGPDGLDLTEVYRFPNGFNELRGYFYWDPGTLRSEIIKGLKEAKKLFPNLTTCGIDTWGVDVALLDATGRLAYPIHAYRDERTNPLVEEIKEKGDDARLYEWTGLPPINYNTGIQLAETLRTNPGVRDAAVRALQLPNFFGYLLTGTQVNEISIASTGMFLDLNSDRFSPAALDYFGIPEGWFEGPEKAGRSLGKIDADPDLSDIEVMLVPGHDTSCAFEAIPLDPETPTLLISAGTWLLVGALTDRPTGGEEAFSYGISNERAGDGSYRPNKIILGLWLLEQLMPSFDDRPQSDAAWSALIEKAEGLKPAPKEALIDTDDQALFNPKNMKAAIDDQLRGRGLTPPDSLAGYTRLICDSLGNGAAIATGKFRNLTGQAFGQIAIVGGGSKNRLLCQRIADYSGIPVVSYTLEGTAVGNIAWQLIGSGAVDRMATFHAAIRPALQPRTFQPKQT
ncbi:MAG: rhamnulokinase [Opitutales bacterium]